MPIDSSGEVWKLTDFSGVGANNFDIPKFQLFCIKKE